MEHLRKLDSNLERANALYRDVFTKEQPHHLGACNHWLFVCERPLS